MTVAVKVTVCPTLTALGEAVTVVVVLSLFTTWLIAGETGLALKLPSPLVYAAVIEWLPVLRALVVKVA